MHIMIWAILHDVSDASSLCKCASSEFTIFPSFFMLDRGNIGYLSVGKIVVKSSGECMLQFPFWVSVLLVKSWCFRQLQDTH
mmetsp:Transcript_65642/g.116861  ORF Transcript_65642/g.116861 Transcript_65642/m.116861 type:complete len:82 (-) Transcript_65642:520-765(-)